MKSGGVKKAPKGSSHKVGTKKPGTAGTRGLHGAGKTIPTFDSERNAKLEGGGPAPGGVHGKK